MNKVFLIGRLTRDPEVRMTVNQVATATFSIAVDRTYTNQSGEREADFINIVAWRKQAENIGKYLTKGSQIAVDGRIQTRSYDAQDGTKRYVTEVIADNVQFLGGSNQRNNSTATSFDNGPSPYDFSSQNDSEQNIPFNNITSDPYQSMGESIQISDEDLPF